MRDTMSIKSQVFIQEVCTSLSRVCWAWNREATQYLYEDIRLDSVQNIEALIVTLSTRTERSERLRSYIARLDLLAPNLKWIWTPDDPPLATHLCKLAPNLKTLVSTINRHDELRAMPDVLPPNLERLCFVDSFALPGQAWTSFLDTHPQLLSVNMPTLSDCDLMGKGRSYPYLQELLFDAGICSVEDYTSILPKFSFPNLQTLTLHSTPSYQLHHFSAFMSCLGHHLHTIHLTYGSQDEHLLPASELFPMFTEFCPNLREVIYTLTEMLIESQLELCAKESEVLRGVTTFSIQMIDPPDSSGRSRMQEGDWMLVLDLAYYWAGRLPDLEKICFSEETNVDTLRERSHADELQTFLDDLELMGASRKKAIVVEDRFGQRLRVQK